MLENIFLIVCRSFSKYVPKSRSHMDFIRLKTTVSCSARDAVHGTEYKAGKQHWGRQCLGGLFTWGVFLEGNVILWTHQRPLMNMSEAVVVFEPGISLPWSCSKKVTRWAWKFAKMITTEGSEILEMTQIGKWLNTFQKVHEKNQDIVIKTKFI